MERKVVHALKPGDVLEMSTSRLPNVERFKAAVESVGEGQFAVFSLDLSGYDIWAEDLTFDNDKLDYHIFNVQDAETAVPKEARGLKKGELVRTTDGKRQGYVVAALDGFVYLISPDGEDWSCGSNHLVKVELP